MIYVRDFVHAERKREFLRNHSAHRVHTAAWRVRHDQRDRMRRDMSARALPSATPPRHRAA